jgi:hypothetical protein
MFDGGFGPFDGRSAGVQMEQHLESGVTVHAEVVSLTMTVESGPFDNFSSLARKHRESSSSEATHLQSIVFVIFFNALVLESSYKQKTQGR